MADKRIPPADIDAEYGLEPVLDVSAPRGALDDFLEVHCPFCGETYGLAVERAAGSRSFIEDCTVCCRPLLLRLEVNEEGDGAVLRASRTG